MSDEQDDKPKKCEVCGESFGVMNSRFYFSNPASDPDCGDWVCELCEQQGEEDERDWLSFCWTGSYDV